MTNESQLIYENKIYDGIITLSIIVPTYKRISTLKETLNSIKPNDGIKYEIIIVDNSKIEDTVKTLEFVKSLTSLNIYYYLNKINLGMVGNWNAGLNLANGEFVAYLHDDDILDDCYFDVIDRIINCRIQNREKLGFIKARFDFFSEIEKVKHTKSPLYTYRRMYMIESLINGVGPTGPPTCGIIFNRKALNEIGGFDEELYPCADHIIGFKLLEKKYLGYYTDDIIGHYRWSINESMKKSTLIDTVDINAKIREYFYKYNLFYMIFGVAFKKTQYTSDVLTYIEHAKRFKVSMAISEILKRPDLYIKNKILYHISRLFLLIFEKAVNIFKKLFKK